MNNIDKQYQQLLGDILDNGVEKKDRTGTGTISVFGRQIRHKMSEGFPLLTTKKMAWKTMVTELLWFLRGETNIKFLLDYDCHIWDGDAWKSYQRKTLEKFMDDTTIAGYAITNKEDFIKKIKTDEKFAKEYGDLGPIYGKQWRKWGERKHDSISNEYFIGIDQIQNLINELKTNPDSRRLMVSAWNVGQLDEMVLPPCHYGFQVYTRELSVGERVQYVLKDESDDPYYERQVWNQELIDKNVPKRAISLMWNQRSVDTFLGLPFNIASYGLLLEIIAKELNMIPEELTGNLGDTHLYLNHIEQAKEQITRVPYELPTIQITERNWYLHEAVKEHMGKKTLDEKLKSYRPDCFELLNYQSHPKIKAPLSN